MSCRDDRFVVRVTASGVPCTFQDVSSNTVPTVVIPAARKQLVWSRFTRKPTAGLVNRPSAAVVDTSYGRENDWKELKKKKKNLQRKRKITQQYSIGGLAARDNNCI